VVDYADMTSNALHIPVKIDRKSSFIQLIRITPEAVEYLIETN